MKICALFGIFMCLLNTGLVYSVPLKAPLYKPTYTIGPDGSVVGGINISDNRNLATGSRDQGLAVAQHLALSDTFVKRPGENVLKVNSQNIGLDVSMKQRLAENVPRSREEALREYYPEHSGYSQVPRNGNQWNKN